MNLGSVIDTNKLGVFYVSDGTLICNGLIKLIIFCIMDGTYVM